MGPGWHRRKAIRLHGARSMPLATPLYCAPVVPTFAVHRAAIHAPVAQLDRVLPSEGRGRGFESRRAHHYFP